MPTFFRTGSDAQNERSRRLLSYQVASNAVLKHADIKRRFPKPLAAPQVLVERSDNGTHEWHSYLTRVPAVAGLPLGLDVADEEALVTLGQLIFRWLAENGSLETISWERTGKIAVVTVVSRIGR
jgi:hypothetical protein